MDDLTPQEQEEFEFRNRLEQEQAPQQAAPSAEPQGKVTVSGAPDFTAPSFTAGAIGTALGAVAGPGIKSEVEKYGIPGLRSTVASAPADSLQGYLNTQLGGAKGNITVEQLSNAVGKPIRTQSEVQDALRLIKGTEGKRVPVTKLVDGVQKTVYYKDVAPKAPVDLSNLGEAREFFKRSPIGGKIMGVNLAEAGPAVRRGVEATGDFLNRVISPHGMATAGSRALGALGGLDVGLQGTSAVEHALKGEWGRAAASGLGAIGGAAALTRHPLLMPIGMGAAIAAPYLESYLEGVAKQHPTWHMAAGGQIAIKEGGLVHLR